MTKTIGVIGVGKIGDRHATNLKKLGHKVIGYDPARWKNGSVEELWEQSDAVVIASPTSTHAEYIEAAKANGTSVFVEKPIASDLTVVGHTDRVAMVGYNLRFHSCVLRAKAWIDGGMIGTPLWGNFVCAEKRNGPIDHVIFNWSHEIDLALHLLGACNVVACAADDGMADIILVHPISNSQSTIHLDYETEPNIRQSIIVGTKATIILDLISHHAWLRSREGSIIDHVEGQSWDQMYVDEIESFLARTDGKQTVGATADEAIEVLRVCHEALRIAA